MDCIKISAERSNYSAEKTVKDGTMTVGELIDYLRYECADYLDSPVVLSFDNGYTYGPITEGQFEIKELYNED